MNKEVFTLRQLLKKIQKKEQQALDKKNHKETLRYHLIGLGVEQSIQALKQVYHKIEKPYEVGDVQ